MDSLFVCLSPFVIVVLILVTVLGSPERNALNEPISTRDHWPESDAGRARLPETVAGLPAGGRAVRAARCALADRAQQWAADASRWRLWHDARRVCAWGYRRLSEIRQREG